MESKYLFKKSTGEWVFGNTITSFCPIGFHRLEIADNKICIFHIIDKRVEFIAPVGYFLKADGSPYASLAEFIAATTVFFSNIDLATGHLTIASRLTLDFLRPANTSDYAAGDVISPYINTKQKETLTLSGSAPEKQKETLTLTGAAPEKQKETLTLTGAAPEKQKEKLTLTGAAPEKQKETITLTGSAAKKQKDTITLSGTSGTAVIIYAGGLEKGLEFNASLTQTASDFVTNHAAAYLAVGIVVTSDGENLIFESNTFGTPFDNPDIINASDDLDGSVVNTQANVVIGQAEISAAGALTKTATFATAGTADLTQTAADFVTANAAAYLAEGIVLTSAVADLVFESDTAGTPFTAPVITSTLGDLDGSVVTTQANVVIGEAEISAAGALTKTATFATAGTADLTQTAADFVTANAAAYLAEGIVLTSAVADLIFESDTAGIPFTAPVITSTVGDLDGSVATTQANVVIGEAEISAAGALAKTVTFATAGTADLTQTAADFVTANAAAYLAEGIVLTSLVADLIFESDTAGTPFTAPVITSTVGDLDGSVVTTQANVLIGEAEITLAGGLTKTATFATAGTADLTQTAADFVTANAAAYLAEGIVLTSLVADLIFESDTAGTPFTAPVITSTVGDLDGSVATTQANVLIGEAEITLAGGLTKTATFATAGTADLTQTAADFVTANAADYLAEGIVLTSLVADLIFESDTAGTPFTAPVITSTVGDLDGSVVTTTENVTEVAQSFNNDASNINGSGGNITTLLLEAPPKFAGKSITIILYNAAHTVYGDNVAFNNVVADRNKRVAKISITMDSLVNSSECVVGQWTGTLGYKCAIDSKLLYAQLVSNDAISAPESGGRFTVIANIFMQ